MERWLEEDVGDLTENCSFQPTTHVWPFFQWKEEMILRLLHGGDTKALHHYPMMSILLICYLKNTVFRFGEGRQLPIDLLATNLVLQQALALFCKIFLIF